MRFHQNALPTIKVEFTNNWWGFILQGKLDTKIKKYLKKWEQKEDRCCDRRNAC